MTSRQTDFKERQDRILCIAVEQYIATVSPVSSSYIAKRYFPCLSSATIRNILAILEAEGYLTHPHTSAGRIPTQKGYRYYVDNLMDEIHLLEDEKAKIKEEYRRQSLELEEMLEKTSEVLSDVTHYTGIVSVDGSSKKLFCCGTSSVVNYPDYQDISKIQNILRALDEKERLLRIINRELESRINIFIGQEIDCSGINSCSLVISPYKTRKGASGRIAILGPTRMNYEKVVSTLDYFSEIMKEIF